MSPNAETNAITTTSKQIVKVAIMVLALILLLLLVSVGAIKIIQKFKLVPADPESVKESRQRYFQSSTRSEYFWHAESQTCIADVDVMNLATGSKEFLRRYTLQVDCVKVCQYLAPSVQREVGCAK